jgi:hypothetical protein
MPDAAAAPPLTGSSRWQSALWAVTAAFGAYFCMYAFRKPFTAAKYADTFVAGIDFKTVLVTAQVFGYMLSKFIGIRVVSELPAPRRAWMVLWLILLAEGALVLFGLLPRPWNAVCLFLNGLPLGMVFGLVLGLLEGRRLTEALAAGLCASFILADGVTKSVGAWLLDAGVGEAWMPSVAGACFLPPLGVCVAMLMRITPPDDVDRDLRSERATMDSADRRAFLRRYGAGLIPLLVIYLLMTILRSIRADFAPELWRGLGVTAPPAVFTQTEMIVAFGVLLATGATVFLQDNRRAFAASLWTCAAGIGLLLVALVVPLSPFAFMVCLGLGLYLPYVAFHTTVFERMLAMTRARANIGFLMSLADAVGYLGYVGVMLGRNFYGGAIDAKGLVVSIGWFAALVSFVCLALSASVFLARTPITQPASEPA